ncbi:MAG: aldo/keto reductase [Planctomycetota bacterium]|nr:aldo/keto reductase [Planctomycetota bacterium]
MADEITRREFNALVAAGAAATGVAAASARADEEKKPGKAEQPEEVKKTRSYNPEMLYRRLGKTGLWVSAVCMGGHWKRIEKMGAAKGEAFDKNRADVISRCLEVGINYIDACCGSEVMAYSKALKGRREKMFFGFSWYETEMRFVPWRKTEKLMESLDKGMKQAGLDYVDLWRITMLEKGGLHTDAEMEEAMRALEQAKKEGKARFTGISCHDRPWIKAQVEKYKQLEVIVTPYTADSAVLPKDSIFEAVQKQDVGVFGIKPFASNSLFKGDGSPDSPFAEEDSKRARLAIRYILGNPSITAPIPGLISTAQVDNVVKAIKEGPGLTEAEGKELRLASQEMWAQLPVEYGWLRDHRFV